MRLAARSNWLTTMAFPDIVVRAAPGERSGGAVAAKDAPRSAAEAAAGQAGRRVLGFRERVPDVGAAPAPLAVREDSDHVRALPGGAGLRVDGVLQQEDETRAPPDDGADERRPGVVLGERPSPPGYEQRAGLGVETRTADQRHAQAVRNRLPGVRRRADGHDLPEA